MPAKLMPFDPTEKMLQAGSSVVSGGSGVGGGFLIRIYQAMHAVAPPPAQTPEAYLVHPTSHSEGRTFLNQSQAQVWADKHKGAIVSPLFRAPHVSVKPLEWVRIQENHWGSCGLLTHYQIIEESHGFALYLGSGHLSQHASLTDAFSAANLENERRVLSCLAGPA